MDALSDGIISLIELNPVQAQELAASNSPLPSVADYPHSDSAATARIYRDCLNIDNWVPGFGLHLIQRCSDGLVIGDVGFRTPPDERGVVEISYGLAESVRGQGFASRALRLLINSALASGNISAVIAETSATNTDSIQVLEAVGFTRIRSQGDKLRYRLLGTPRPKEIDNRCTAFIVIVVFVPLSAADLIRAALANAGAGEIGEYSACSFSATGQGRFRPSEIANPYIGTPGQLEIVDEVRIECVVPPLKAKAAISAMLAAHPYQEPAWHCYQTLNLTDL